MEKIRGKCLCEGVKYEISGELSSIYNCHCSKCRRWHGAAFRSRASIEVFQFTLLSGEELLSAFKSSGHVTKYFCKVCGSPLHSTYANKPNVLGIALGALEGVKTKPKANIFTVSKASWYDINDELPQYESWPGNEAKVRETKD